MCTSRSLLWILLIAVISQRAYCQDADDPYTADDTEFENDNESPAEAPSGGEEEPGEGSGAHSLDDTTINVPLIEETVTETISDDAIKCPIDLCTCSHEYEGETLKLTVDCSSKDLTEMPTNIDNRVKYLFLQNNKITGVPKSISEFKELEELNVNDNLITDFAYGSVSELSKLRVLKAANNRLLQFPQELKNGLDLRSLEDLDLGGNDMRETLAAENFSHMESIKSLIIPVSTAELIEELCHRLGTTLQKVCTNNCETDIKECATFSESFPGSITAPSSDTVENNNGTVIPVRTLDNDTTGPVNEADPSSDLSSSNIEQPEIQSGVVIEGINGEIETPTETPTAEENSPNAGESSTTEFSLRSAVSNTNDDTISPVSLSSGVSLLETPAEGVVAPAVGVETSAGAETPADGMITSAVGAAQPEAGAAGSTSNIATRSGAVKMETDTASDPVGAESDKVGAASTIKQGGGVDNSVIALIVAGMVIVVAGVTIKKNWNSIRDRFRPRPTPAAGQTAHANGTAPEEVPLQDKSMV